MSRVETEKISAPVETVEERRRRQELEEEERKKAYLEQARRDFMERKAIEARVRRAVEAERMGIDVDHPETSGIPVVGKPPIEPSSHAQTEAPLELVEDALPIASKWNGNLGATVGTRALAASLRDTMKDLRASGALALVDNEEASGDIASDEEGDDFDVSEISSDMIEQHDVSDEYVGSFPFSMLL